MPADCASHTLEEVRDDAHHDLVQHVVWRATDCAALDSERGRRCKHKRRHVCISCQLQKLEAGIDIELANGGHVLVCGALTSFVGDKKGYQELFYVNEKRAIHNPAKPNSPAWFGNVAAEVDDAWPPRRRANNAPVVAPAAPLAWRSIVYARDAMARLAAPALPARERSALKDELAASGCTFKERRQRRANDIVADKVMLVPRCHIEPRMIGVARESHTQHGQAELAICARLVDKNSHCSHEIALRLELRPPLAQARVVGRTELARWNRLVREVGRRHVIGSHVAGVAIAAQFAQ
jgi:hypothetical protein